VVVVRAAVNMPPANLFEGAWKVAADHAHQERAGGEFYSLSSCLSIMCPRDPPPSHKVVSPPMLQRHTPLGIPRMHEVVPPASHDAEPHRGRFSLLLGCRGKFAFSVVDPSCFSLAVCPLLTFSSHCCAEIVAISIFPAPSQSGRLSSTTGS
jgi:hypothetical protein